MRRLVTYLINNYQDIRTVSLFLISAIILILLFPYESKFRYEFQKGKPWMHDEYIAPFDFPIYKTESEVTTQRDSILKEFKPYFRLDREIMTNQLLLYQNAFDEKWKEWNAGLKTVDTIKRNQYFQFAADLLIFVYNKGVVSSNEILDRGNQNNRMLVILREQLAEDQEFSEVFTPKTAYEYVIKVVADITDSIPDRIDKEFFQSLNINEFMIPNLVYDEETSNRVKQELVNQISLTKGMVQSGERIISRGDLVTNEKFLILESLKREYEVNMGLSDNLNLTTLGKILISIISMLVLYFFLYSFRPEVLQSFAKSSFVLLFILLMATLSSLTIRYNVLSLYVLPFAIVPIIMRTFFDARLALFIHLLATLIVGFWAPNGFEFVFLNLMVGIVAIFSLTNSYRRGILFVTAVLVVITYSTVFFAFSILQEGRFDKIDYKLFLWFGGNGLLVLAAYPLVFIFEKAFGFLSDSTLFELSDSNQPLLRELAEKAPGTFQHSLQVANLAEEVIFQIGGNALLIRVGALYHDIGKMSKPQYFIENQITDQNPHDDLEFEQSAEIIIGHVHRGVEIAKKHNLPQPMIDFIRSHHGTTMVQYFYRSFLKKHPEEEAELSRFTYPGPKPFTKEQAVLMMADSVEASSRSLKTKDEETLEDLVNHIIDDQVKQGQFDQADISFRDVNKIKEILISKLLNIYHIRIEYPSES